MAFNISELRDILEINRSDMTNDRVSTNDLIIDDFMVELGYNRKKDKSVKRLHEGPIDWEVLSATGSRIAVKVFAIGEALSQEELNEAMKVSAEKRFSIFIVTNGEALTICRFRKDKGEYAEICDISFTNDLDETSDRVLTSISKDGWDLQYIDSLIKDSGISDDKIIEVIKSSVDDIANVVISKIDGISDSDKEQCKSVVNKFISETREVVKEVTKEVPTETVDTSAFTEQISALTKELETTKSELSDAREKLLDAQENGVSASSDSEKDAKIEELEKQVKELTATMVSDEGIKDVKIEELETEVHRLKRKLNSTSMFTTGDESVDEQINNYRDQINALTIQNANNEETIKDLEEKLKAAQDEIDNMSGIEKKKAHELLMVIEDVPDMDRQYVGVVNTELLQYDEIHTFVGRSLQKLYEIKRLEASQYIFNGDIFKLSQPAIRNDLIMNNKQYDVNFSDMYEDEVLNKLRILFSHFSDVVFECKKIGTLRDKTGLKSSAKGALNLSKNEDLTSAEEIAMIDAESSSEEEAVTDIDFSQDIEVSDTQDELNDNAEVDESLDGILEDVESFDESEASEIDFSNNMSEGDGFGDTLDVPDGAFEEGIDMGEVNTEDGLDIPDGAFENFTVDNDNGETDGQQFENGFDSGFEVDGQSTEDNWDTSEEEMEDFGETTGNSQMTEALLVAQLLQIDDLIWMEDVNINFKNIKYIGSNSVTFNINKDAELVSNEQLLCKCVDAIMAIESYNGNAGIVSQLKQTDFSQINNFLHLYTEEYKGYPRINGTKYIASNVSTIQSICSILYDICQYMNISMEEIFIYMTAETDAQDIIDNYGYSDEAVQLRDYSQFDMNPDNKVIAIIRGDLFNNIVVTKNSLQAHKDIVNDAIAVKTKYLSKALNNENDLIEAVVEIIIKASETGNINFAAVGNVIGENYRLLSDKQYEVGPEPIEIDAGGSIYYMAKLEKWQILHSLIKMHTALFGNTGIAIKIVVNADAINFYGQSFDTSEPSLSLAIRSFADYVAANVKR